MLISIAIENWMSFRDRAAFSMLATRERQHGARVPRLTKYDTRVLPIAAIYGGNASGKTNLFAAISFAQRLIIRGTRPDTLIPVTPFLLDEKGTHNPSRFEFQLLIDDTIYVFSFAVTQQAVLEEKLVRISRTSETVLYNRRDGKAHFDGSLRKDKMLEFAFRGTRDNQLFLNNTVSQKIETFKPVYDWFKDTLEMIAPDARFEPFEQYFNEDTPLYEKMNAMLQQLDTGIVHLGSEEMPYKSVPLPEQLKTRIQEEVKDKEAIGIRLDAGNTRFVITREEGELVAKKLVTFHVNENGQETRFEIQQESDGTRRVIDLLPAFVDLMESDSPKVYVVDEIDRSLHTLLIRRLLEAYLAGCSTESRSQILLTTHDILLMDQQLLRRDEMWVTERGTSGNSRLFSFSEYKDVRYDKDIRKSYLKGRLGGIPRILLGGEALAVACRNPEEEDEA